MGNLFHFLNIEPTADETLIRAVIADAQQARKDVSKVEACRYLLLNAERRRHYLYRLQTRHYDSLCHAMMDFHHDDIHQWTVFDPKVTPTWQKLLMFVLLLTSCLALLPHLQQLVDITPALSTNLAPEPLPNSNDISPH